MIICGLALPAFVSAVVKPTKGLFVSGTVTSLDMTDSTEKVAGEISVRVFCDTIQVAETITTRGGRYQFEIPFGNVYTIEFGGDSFCRKSIEIDCEQVSAKVLRQGHKMDIDIMVFESENPVWNDLLVKPVAKAFFDRRKNTFKFEEDYTEDRTKLIWEALTAEIDSKQD